jgi:integrase
VAHLVKPWIYRYVKDGKRVPKGTPGAKRVKERAHKWYGQGIPGLPPKKRVPLASNKEAAKRMLAAKVEEAEQGIAGISKQTIEAQRTALESHLADFEASLRNRLEPVSEEQIKLVTARIRKVLDGCRFSYPRDIQADKVLAFLAEQRKLPKEEGGISIQTANFYLSATKQFCRWMCSKNGGRRMRENPLAEAKPGKAEMDPRHHRRDLKPEELLRLFEVARKSTTSYRGLTGPDRYMIYHTACGTGFRSGDLGTLKPENFNLEAEPPTVTLPARKSKNKKAATQPLPGGLAAELRDYLKDQTPGARIWPRSWDVRAADMLKIDLEAAGIPYAVEGPDGLLYADFHALRHTYCTMLDGSGASTKARQDLARHSTAKLTLDRYSHSDLADRAAAVAKLPLPGNDASKAKPTVEQLASAVVLLQTILDVFLASPGPSAPVDGAVGPAGGLPALVEPRVAPTSGTDRNGVERDGTDRGGRATGDDLSPAS